jgi:hypothetical protein
MVLAETWPYLLTARWKYSDTIAAEPFKLIVLLFLTAVAAMAMSGPLQGFFWKP